MGSSEFDKYANKYKDTMSLISSLDDWIYIVNLPKTRQKVLDIGCGSGLLLNKLSKYFEEPYGIDISEEMINYAKQRFSKLEFICKDANTLPYPDNYFDMVVSHTTFHHLNRTKAIEEVKRVLKPHGVAVIVDVSSTSNGFIDQFNKLIFRKIYSNIKLKLMYGMKEANMCWEYYSGPEWRAHRNEDKKVELNRNQTKELFNNLLPNCKVIMINYHVDAIIWKKK